MNALRHGLLAEEVVLRSEDAAEFSQFRREMRASLKPVGPHESQLADRIAILAWRLQRCVKVEAVLFDNLASEEKASDNALAFAFAKGTVTFVNLARYERHISGEYFRTLHELDRRQAIRAGHLSPPPAAADIDIKLTVDELEMTYINDILADAEKRELETNDAKTRARKKGPGA